MGTATYQVPNNTTDTASQYKAKIDGNAIVAQQMVAAFACHEAGTPNMTVLVDAGTISFAGQLPTIVGQQTSGTITAPATNPRNDLVVIDANTGVMSIITGTEAASPADPAVTEGKIPVARIALATSTTTITNAIITDLRAPVLAVQGSPATLSISSNTTLTQKQAGMDVFCSGVTTNITLPSPTGCKGAKFRFMGTDTNTQTLTGSFSYPDGTTASSHALVKDETLDVESTGSVWRVVNRQGGGSGMPSGAIMQHGGSTAPAGWLLCTGAAVSRATYAALFTAIGTAYGSGDGSTTFNLPDGRGRAFIGAGTGSGLTARTVGQSGGAETHQLTTAELATHSHSITDPGHTHGATGAAGSHSHTLSPVVNMNNGETSGTPSNGISNTAIPNQNVVVGTAPDHTHTTSSGSTGITATNNAGSGSAHNNMQPFLVGNWIIKT